MNKVSRLAVGTVLSLIAVACGGERGDVEATTGGDESELREFAGTELASSNGLKIKLEMVDGAKPRTKNRRFISGKFTRGSKSIKMWCDSSVSAQKNQPAISSVRCTKGAVTVSNDDDESLSFEIVRKDGALEGTIDYAGDGTFLGEDFAVLAGRNAQGSDQEKMPLSVRSSGDNVDKNPLLLLDRVEGAAKSMLGKTVHIQDDGVDARVKITSLDVLVSDRMTVSFVPRFASSVHIASNDDDASLLRTAGQLASGIVAESTLKDRFKVALKIE